LDIGEPEGTVSPFVEENGLTFPILLDEARQVARLYMVQGIPTSFLIGRDGVILDRHIGPMDKSVMAKFLDEVLR
jgi:peroxiredoxin